MKLNCYDVDMDQDDYCSYDDTFDSNSSESYWLYDMGNQTYLRFHIGYRQVDICHITSIDIEANYPSNLKDIPLDFQHTGIQCILDNGDYLKSL